MIKDLTKLQFAEEMKNWTGENVSFNCLSLRLLKIENNYDIETVFNENNIYEVAKKWKIHKELKVNIHSYFILLNNNSRVDLRGIYFKFNDDILGLIDDDCLFVYCRNK